jgi:hypothetical protein
MRRAIHGSAQTARLEGRVEPLIELVAWWPSHVHLKQVCSRLDVANIGQRVQNVKLKVALSKCLTEQGAGCNCLRSKLDNLLR